MKKYQPDFPDPAEERDMLVLEVKGQDSHESKTKWEFLTEWVNAVNHNGDLERGLGPCRIIQRIIAGILEARAR